MRSQWVVVQDGQYSYVKQADSTDRCDICNLKHHSELTALRCLYAYCAGYVDSWKRKLGNVQRAMRIVKSREAKL